MATALGAFLGVQLIGGEIIDRAHPEVRYASLHERLAALRSQTSTPDLVYLGSSRFAFGLDADEMTRELRKRLGRPDFRVVSAAAPGADPLVMEKVLAEMDRIGLYPPTLVVETAPINLLRFNPWYDLHVRQWITWSDLPEHGWELVCDGQFGRLVLARTMPLLVHRYAILKHLCHPPDDADLADPMPPANESTDLMDDAEMTRLLDPRRVTEQDVERGRDGLDTFARHYRRYPFGGGKASAALERILARCAQQGTRVILVGAPLSSTHREASAPVDAAYRECMDDYQARYGVTFVDCQAALPDSLFFDHHHLTQPEGKFVFSRYLAREVLGPCLDGHSPPTRLVNRTKTP